MVILYNINSNISYVKQLQIIVAQHTQTATVNTGITLHIFSVPYFLMLLFEILY